MPMFLVGIMVGAVFMAATQDREVEIEVDARSLKGRIKVGHRHRLE